MSVVGYFIVYRMKMCENIMDLIFYGVKLKMVSNVQRDIQTGQYYYQQCYYCVSPWSIASGQCLNSFSISNLSCHTYRFEIQFL